MIEIKIDVQKINKSRLYKGKQGMYLTAVLIPTPDGKYGDYMVVEGISKEEREAGKKGTILGNGKNLVKKEAEPPAGVYERTGKYDKRYTESDKVRDSREEMEDGLPW